MISTGALHEDGLADFLDGFGGGTNRDKVLAIKKKSLLFHQLIKLQKCRSEKAAYRHHCTVA